MHHDMSEMYGKLLGSLKKVFYIKKVLKFLIALWFNTQNYQKFIKRTQPMNC